MTNEELKEGLSMSLEKRFTISEKEVPVVADVDVLVVGGGAAGVAAAVAAGRQGANTMLVERYAYLGGLATGAMVIWMHDMDDGQQVTVAGIVNEFTERLEHLNGLRRPANEDLFKITSRELQEKYYRLPFIEPVHRGSPELGNPEFVRHSALVDIEASKYAFFQMVEEAEVNLRLHNPFVEPLTEGDEVLGALLLGKMGLHAVTAKVTIDATGDGDVFANAGADFTAMRYVVSVPHYLGNVDTRKAIRFYQEHPEEAKDLDTEVGRLYEPQGKKGWPADVGGRSTTWWMLSANENMVWGVRPREAAMDALKLEDLTQVEVEGRKRIWNALEFIRVHYPGFENAYVAKVADQTAVRVSRLLLGEHVLTLEEMRRGQQFPDSIGRGANYYYPYRCLLPKKVENLLVVGRCCSVEPKAMCLYRSWPPMMVSGQAAGTAAALAVESGVRVRNVDLPTLQHRLREQRVIL